MQCNAWRAAHTACAALLAPILQPRSLAAGCHGVCGDRQLPFVRAAGRALCLQARQGGFMYKPERLRERAPVYALEISPGPTLDPLRMPVLEAIVPIMAGSASSKVQYPAGHQFNVRVSVDSRPQLTTCGLCASTP